MTGAKRILTTVVLCAPFALAACGSVDAADNDDDTLVIGAAVAKTGSIAPYDEPIMKGFEMGVKEINDAGGIGGDTKIEVLTRDTRSDTQQTVVAVQELIDEGVDVLILECYGEQALAAAEIINEAEIPAVTTCASQPEVQDVGGEYYFGNVFGDNSQGKVSADYAIEQGYEAAFLLTSPDTLFTENMPRYFGVAFEEQGGEVVGQANFTQGQQDFGAVISEIEGTSPEPDVIMTAAYEPDFPAFVRQLRAAGVDTPIIGADGLDTPTTLEIGDPIDGLVFTSIGTPSPEFVEQYRAEYDTEPESHYAPVGLDLIRVIEAAVEAAGSTDSREIRDAWADLENVEGATGEITYAATNRTPVKPVALVQVTDGNFETIDRVIPDPSTLPEIE